MRCVLPAVPQTSPCLTDRGNGRYPGRGAVSSGRGAVSSWPAPPVGRGSWGSMPLAARHTAISRTRAGLGVASRCSPDRLGVTLAGVVCNLAGEVGDQLGSFCQVVVPDGMGME